MNEQDWLGKDVKQVLPVAGCAPMSGVSKVVDAFVDEKGELHCKTASGWWVPARLLERV
jgi:hypothetical protein